MARVIIVTGESVFDGGGTQEIYGSMIANAVTTVNGTPDYLYDCDVMDDLMDSTPTFQVYSWKEDLSNHCMKDSSAAALFPLLREKQGGRL